MSELVNPVWTQSHLFLTMSTYNDTEKMIPGEVELVKDSSFLKNEGTYVAMESFRITGGMQGGIHGHYRAHYTTITPMMRIEAETNVNIVDSAFDRPTGVDCIEQNADHNSITLQSSDADQHNHVD